MTKEEIIKRVEQIELLLKFHPSAVDLRQRPQFESAVKIVKSLKSDLER